MLVTTTSDRISHCRENSVDSNQSDDDGYDMVTGANLTPQMVPEFLTGRPMQSRNKTPHQQCINDDTLDTTCYDPLPFVISLAALAYRDSAEDVDKDIINTFKLC